MKKNDAAQTTDEKLRDATAQEVDAEVFADAPEEWFSYGQRFLYRADSCKGAPVRGYPLDILGYDGSFGQFEMVTIQLTAPTYALNRKRELVKCKKGDVVIITQTYSLEVLTRVANHPTKLHEVYLKPTGKEDIGGGKQLWVYDIRVNPKTIDRIRLDAPQLGMGDKEPMTELVS